MTSSSSSARFRSAAEFPKTIDQLSRSEAEHLYAEMRDCLIFTNRSRAQLIRRNEEHKQATLQVRTEVAQLQQLIQQLDLEKQQLTTHNQQVVSELTQQIVTMSGQLDQLVEAFDGIADVESPTGFMAQPSRFFKFIKALKAIVLFWKDESGTDNLPLPPQRAARPLNLQERDADRRENPRMHQDQASINRSLLDD
ncbi:MAG: hypothetical protein MUF72_08655 [Elainella sp. Prado103]|jgi:hypothetical protein|nr:hypothetical protein [Elainella sp. Prado103]